MSECDVHGCVLVYCPFGAFKVWDFDRSLLLIHASALFKPFSPLSLNCALGESTKPCKHFQKHEVID